MGDGEVGSSEPPEPPLDPPLQMIHKKHQALYIAVNQEKYHKTCCLLHLRVTIQTVHRSS